MMKQNQVELFSHLLLFCIKSIKIVSLIHIPTIHSISKAKFGAADIYSGGARYNSFSRMRQHENGGGSVIDDSIFSSYVPASSVGKWH